MREIVNLNKFILTICLLTSGGCSTHLIKREIANNSNDKLALESKERITAKNLQSLQLEISKSLKGKIESQTLKNLGPICRGNQEINVETTKKLKANYANLESSSEYWYVLGNCSYLNNEDPLHLDKAYHFYKLALSKVDHKNEKAKILNNIGVLLWQRGNLKAAASHFEEASLLGNFLSPSFNLLAMTLSEGQILKSMDLIEKLPKELLGDLEIDLMRAFVKISSNDLGEGLKILNSHQKEYNSLESPFPLAIYLKCFALLQTGKIEEAKDNLQTLTSVMKSIKNPILEEMVQTLSINIETELDKKIESKIVQIKNP